MKMIVKFTVLSATLLLLTGIAFAQGDCECYKVNFTDLDNPAGGKTVYEEICLDYANNAGVFGMCDLSLFPGLITQGLVYGCPCVAYFKFHGYDNNVITGEAHCDMGDRYTFWGHITNCPG